MGLLDDIFGRNKPDDRVMQEELQDWNDIVYTRKDLDMDDPVQRREYIGSCLQQMEEASRQLDALEVEYADVTSHLRDMEEIDSLPPEQRAEVTDCAQRIIESQEQQEKFVKRKSKMTEEDFEHMERLQAQAQIGAEKLLEAENFQKKIKNDLKRLDSEHQAYLFREEELEKTIESSKTLTIVIGVTLCLIIVFLLVLQFGLKLNVTYGYMISILLSAIVITVLYVQSTGALVELKSVKKSISRLIMLQNSVKIRYVNNTNLIDYLCMKYRVMNSSELNGMYEKYLKEKKEREKYEDSRRSLEANQKDLIYILRHYRVKDPDIWVHQVEALLSHNEEVEIRHSLNVQRQSLRKRMEYNRNVVAGNAKREIEDTAKLYPQYAQEILDMVSRYEEMYPNV
ncbi:hypothetical protein [Butyrivibrio sp.]|uniref:hypothetical protein n=1 Tax=Butyrivibrio sp. TaxID=28121 RepID=UPI0025B8BF02|nr:hypothetical protein [Butyrivibrio sp.]MBQ9302972.1 hypothetical protein [Butyrivibrio sp.]